MEREFYKSINNKIKPYKLLDIYTPMDLMLIESLFISHGIPYHCDFKHFMGVKPFVQIINYTNSNFYILEKDYSKAIEVVKNYLKNKRLHHYKLKHKIRNIIELVLISWVAYNPQEILGINVYYKNSSFRHYKKHYIKKRKKI
jgi:hypothetical protein